MQIKPVYWIVLLLLCISQNGPAQTFEKYTLHEGKPEHAGFSQDRLSRIDSVFTEYVDKGYSAGYIGLVARNGEIVYYNSVGYDNISIKTPLKKDAIFRVASQTKAVTSVAVMMLYEEGKFLLDDPISKYLPEFKNQSVIDSFNEKDSSYTTIPVKREITIRDLLRHTSGLGYPMTGDKAMNSIFAKNDIIMGINPGNRKIKDQMKKLGALPLAHQPGEKFTYGLSVDVLGYLVETLTGQSLDTFLRERLFKPIGMNDTYFVLPSEKFNRLCALYGEDKDGKLVKVEKSEGFDPDYPKIKTDYFCGGGGLSSTAYDYSIFIQMMANGGEYNGKRYLSESSVKMMRTVQTGDLPCGSLFILGVPGSYGLGFEVISAKGSIQSALPEGTFGWGGTFGSLYWIDPVNNIIAQLVIQKGPNRYEDIRKKFIALVYQSLEDYK